jgi:hypothetical protein
VVEAKQTKVLSLLDHTNNMWTRFKGERIDVIQVISTCAFLGFADAAAAFGQETVPGLLARLKDSSAGKIDQSRGEQLSLTDFSQGVSSMRKYQVARSVHDSSATGS